MTWMLLYLTVQDNIHFITDQTDSTIVLSYQKFLDYIGTMRVNHYLKLVDEINTFQTIFVDFRTGHWNVYFPQKEEATFEQLVRVNEQKKANTDIPHAFHPADHISNLVKKLRIADDKNTRNRHRPKF
jgi:hypothetical protein